MLDGDKTLHLHIGTHKTGSTSFQRSLRANARELTRRGHFPFGVSAKRGGALLGGKKYNIGIVTDTFLRPGIASISRVASGLRPDPADMEHARTGFLTKIKARTDRNLILSSEALTFLRTPAEKEAMHTFLDAIERKVQIVLVQRDETSWRASWENHLRRKPKVWQCNQSLPDEQRANGEWYFDIQAIVDFWSDLGEIAIVDYNAALEGEGNVVPAIYRAMGIDPRGLKTEFKRNRRVVLGNDGD